MLSRRPLTDAIVRSLVRPGARVGDVVGAVLDVEVLDDTATRLAPVTREDALEMLDELRMAPVLRGVRGEAAVDRAALAETIARFARLAVDFPELVEIEVNPLVATASGAVAVDARAMLEGDVDGNRD